MIHLRRKNLFKAVVHLVIVALVAPILQMAVSVPADAQLVETMSIGLADFTNRSGVLGDALSRVASGAVYIEINKARRFDVITDSQMKAAMSDLGLKSPLSFTDLLRLGSDLEADAILEGEITSAPISKEPQRVSVTLALKMIDVASGELLNGAIVTGSSSPRVGYTTDLDTMATEAVNSAAYLAVKTMVDYIIPEATVQNTIGTNEVLLNKGSRDGIRVGMRMVVLRQTQGGKREVVGRILVKEANPNDATATITYQPKGVKPEDNVRAIYDMPGYKAPSVMVAGGEKPAAPARVGKLGGTKKLLLTILAAVAVATIFRGGSGAEDTGAEGTGSSVLVVDSPFVKARCPSKLKNQPHVLQFKLWRDHDTVVAVADGAWARSGWLQDSPAAPGGSYLRPDPQNPNALVSTAIGAAGLILGESHNYFVSAVYETSEPAATAKTYWETDLADLGQGTPLARIPASDLTATTKGQQDVDLRHVDFGWKSTTGADKYRVQATVASDTQFKNPRYTSDDSFWPQKTGGQQLVIEDQNISSFFSGLKEGDRIWWRVAAKNSGDAGPPAKGYTYSEPAFIIVGEQPPPPPG